MPQAPSSSPRNPKRQRGRVIPAFSVSPASRLAIAVLLTCAILAPATTVANDPPPAPPPRGPADVHVAVPVTPPEHLPILARFEKLENKEVKDALHIRFTTWNMVVEQVGGDAPSEQYRAVQGIQEFDLKSQDYKLEDLRGRRLQADRIPKSGSAVLLFGDGGISRSATECLKPDVCVIRVLRLPPLPPRQATRYEPPAPADLPPQLP